MVTTSDASMSSSSQSQVGRHANANSVVTPLPCRAPTALPRHALTRGFLTLRPLTPDNTSFSNSSLDQRNVLPRLPDPDDVQRAVLDRAVMAQLAEGPGTAATHYQRISRALTTCPSRWPVGAAAGDMWGSRHDPTSPQSAGLDPD